MIINEREIRHEQVLLATCQMLDAAKRMNILQDCKCVFAIPVNASSKNPFFDRKPKKEV